VLRDLIDQKEMLYEVEAARGDIPAKQKNQKREYADAKQHGA
jgi:hypothetical protein